MHMLVKQSLALAYVLTPVLALPSSSPSTCHAVCSANKTQLSTKVACRENSPFNTQLGECLECLQANPSEIGGTEARWYSSALRNAISTCLYSHPEPQSHGLSVSSCATDKACLSLNEVLVEQDLKLSLDYCAHSLTSCMSCLQESKSQSYLYESLLTLKTLCPNKSHPFINQHFIFSRSQGTSSEVSPGAIAGAIVALLLLFMAAVGLFLIYFQQQRRFRETHESQFAASQPKSRFSLSLSSHKPACHTHRCRSDSSESIDRCMPPVSSDMGRENVNHAFDPRSTNRGPDAALPTHQAYIPHPLFEGPQTDPVTERQDPSALSSGQDGAHDASVTYLPPLPAPLPAAYPAAARPKGRKMLALQIPPLPNLKLPKIHSPLRCLPGQSKKELQISRPILQTDLGPDIQSSSDVPEHPKGRGPTSGNPLKQPKTADELPIRSPKSILYG
ncbi:hypothetical protein CDD81_3631 [Ophiocordyceps australis]|uniref:Extracellular membrane protein CFEM domain-containing protein n=1 Tax=Ophiocordyceps australis TaxID=1399860 RepID=A0A2C5YDE8_9HYPO|nr:hypothetical protein CDD81_3631 [Ophiocordyceps australis]